MKKLILLSTLFVSITSLLFGSGYDSWTAKEKLEYNFCHAKIQKIMGATRSGSAIKRRTSNFLISIGTRISFRVLSSLVKSNRLRMSASTILSKAKIYEANRDHLAQLEALSGVY